MLKLHSEEGDATTEQTVKNYRKEKIVGTFYPGAMPSRLYLLIKAKTMMPLFVFTIHIH